MKAAFFLALLYAALIFGLSSIPGHSLPDLKWLSFDKFIHIGEYSVFSFLVIRTLVYKMTDGRYLFVATLFIAGAFGALDEVYQSLIPGRLNSYADWVADVVGVVLGSLAFLRWKFARAQTTAG